MVREELYDVVDENGNKIGEARWTEVHTKGLLHQNVHGIVFSDKNKEKTFIKKRAKNVDQEAEKYEIAVAGHVRSGETPDETIKREIKEELFNTLEQIPADISIEKLTTYFNNDLPNNHEIAHLYVIIHPGPFSLQKEGANSSDWVGWDELKKDIRNNPSKYAQYSINAISTYSNLNKE